MVRSRTRAPTTEDSLHQRQELDAEEITVMQVTILGSGAPLSPRATTGLWVTAPECEPLLVDTCGGFELAGRLKASGIALSEVRNVIATHRHLDHIGGFAALFLAVQPLVICASAVTQEGIRLLMAAGFPEWTLHPDVRRVEVAAGECHEIGGFTVRFFPALHRVPTLATRIERGGRALAFSADTISCEGVVECARDADRFLCGCCYAERDGERFVADARAEMHLTARQAGRLARTANARSLVLTHLSRHTTPASCLIEAGEEYEGPLAVAEDGAAYAV